MAKAFVIPSIFTAVDRLSAPVRAMGASVGRFADRAESAVARSNRMFRRMTPTIGAAGSELLSFAKSAAIATAIVGGVSFSVKSLKDYETAVASFRTIVSDATDKEFAAYESAIASVAKTTNKSSIDVAASFEKIAGLNAEFAETADGLGKVSQAAIVLAKASGMELGSSAESLVGIMNQFSMSAEQADRAINVLAAGQAVGAANIQQTSDSFVNFGATAAGANITLEESVALIQTLGKFSLFGAEAGTKLRGAVIKLQQANVGYASGQFNINDALVEAKAKIDKLATAKQKDAALTKMFGMENVTAGRILLGNIETYKSFATAVTGTSEAQKAAEINSQSLTVKLDEMKNKWVNLITSSDGASTAMNAAKRVIGFVTENMDALILVGGSLLGFFAAWKIANMVATASLVAYNVVLGISGAITGTVAIAVGRNTAALAAYNIMSKLVTAATWLWTGAQTALNWILSMNPIGLVILAIAALVAAIVWIASKTEGWGKTWESVWSFVVAVFDMQKYALITGFLMIVDHFLSMTDSIVSAWYWTQNKIGLMSDETYKKNIALIDAESKARQAAINKNSAHMKVAANKVSQGIDWQVKMKTDEAEQIDPPVNQKQAQQKAMAEQMSVNSQHSLNVNLQDPRLQVATASPNVNVKTTSTKGF